MVDTDGEDVNPQGTLFGFQPEKAEKILLQPLRHRIWTENKARLVTRYLNYFLFITRHGTYIDGFAGPQYAGQKDSWAAKAVLELTPRWLRNFFLCDIDPNAIAALQKLSAEQPPPDKAKGEPKRDIRILPGDFNVSVSEILASGKITEREATFALLDQRTFECTWETVTRLARHKRVGNKIELFYFLAIKWLHRAIAGTGDTTGIEAWWGDDTWSRLRDANQQSICDAVREKFIRELGYKHVHPWPIFESEDGGAVMYYMIQATDHPEAPILMRRAYENALRAPEPIEQLQLDVSTGDYLGARS